LLNNPYRIISNGSLQLSRSLFIINKHQLQSACLVYKPYPVYCTSCWFWV